MRRAELFENFTREIVKTTLSCASECKGHPDVHSIRLKFPNALFYAALCERRAEKRKFFFFFALLIVL